MLIIFAFISLSVFQDADKLIELGYEKYLEEDYTAAVKLFDEAEKVDPDNQEIYYLRGVSKSLMQNKKGAMADLEKAVSLKPDYAVAYYEIGYLFITDRNAQKAIDAFDQAIAINPEFAEAYVTRGTAKCMLEDALGANQDWQKAKELGVKYSEYMVCE